MLMKTQFREFLKKAIKNDEQIARGLSPFQPEKVAFEAGRIMLKRIDELFKNQVNFAFETTLATKIYKQKIQFAKENGYNTTLLFFWLKNSDLAKERVKIRVNEGGHNIPSDVIERRYLNGIKNLFNIYLEIIDQVLIFDNSEGKPILIGEKNFSEEIIIYDQEKFIELKNYYDKRS